MKVYLAGGISDTDRKEGQAKTGGRLERMGFDVYAPALNNSINDKSNNPTPLDIYNGDIDRVKESDIFVVRISGGNEDGTLSEVGMVAGWNEREYQAKIVENKQYEPYNPIKIVAYCTNERLMQPQFWNGMASGGFNHLVAGMIDKWGVFVGGEEEMIDHLMNIALENGLKANVANIDDLREMTNEEINLKYRL